MVMNGSFVFEKLPCPDTLPRTSPSHRSRLTRLEVTFPVWGSVAVTVRFAPPTKYLPVNDVVFIILFTSPYGIPLKGLDLAITGYKTCYAMVSPILLGGHLSSVV